MTETVPVTSPGECGLTTKKGPGEHPNRHREELRLPGKPLQALPGCPTLSDCSASTMSVSQLNPGHPPVGWCPHLTL